MKGLNDERSSWEKRDAEKLGPITKEKIQYNRKDCGGRGGRHALKKICWTAECRKKIYIKRWKMLGGEFFWERRRHPLFVYH